MAGDLAGSELTVSHAEPGVNRFTLYAATRYKVEQKMLSEADVFFVTLLDSLAQPRVTVQWLQEGHAYEFRVSAGCNAGFQSNSARIAVTPMAPLPAFEIVRFGAGFVDLAWEGAGPSRDTRVTFQATGDGEEE